MLNDKFKIAKTVLLKKMEIGKRGRKWKEGDERIYDNKRKCRKKPFYKGNYAQIYPYLDVNI